MASDKPATVGTIAAQPTTGTVVLDSASYVNYPFFHLKFTLDAALMTVTDAAGSGSSGSLKLFDFNPFAFAILGCRQDYTAFAEGSALTTAAGDAAFVMGLGTVAANAGDGVLTSTEVDIGIVTSTITLSSGTGTGTQVNGPITGGVNGTATASDIYLNWSGTAATIDATSTIAVTGTIEIVGVILGDD